MSPLMQAFMPSERSRISTLRDKLQKLLYSNNQPGFLKKQNQPPCPRDDLAFLERSPRRHLFLIYSITASGG